MIGTWNRALITGASSGIGQELARQLAAQGSDLVVVARNQERLYELADELSTEHQVNVEVFPADLGDRLQVDRVAQRIQAEDRPIDLVVNNAGFGFSGYFHELDLAGQSATVDVNITALHRLSHAAAKTMVPRGRGGILNISSIAGYMVSPKSATYAATKSFVTSFSEALHEELRDFGVTATAVCPGLTHTEFHERANLDTSDYPDFAWQSASDVAREALEALSNKQAKAITGNLNKVLASGSKLLPSMVVRKIAMSRKP